jgi:hypothetical protein
MHWWWTPDGNLVEFGQAHGPEVLGSARRANGELMLWFAWVRLTFYFVAIQIFACGS